MSNLSVVESDKIPGLFFIKLDVFGDNRGWFKENYQKEKLEQLGLPKIDILQNNVSFNHEKGVTRGVHAEPWDKYISVANGRIFVAIIDLRPGDNYGAKEEFEIDINSAIYVPRGCGNSYQTLEENTVYTYLVNDHWSPEAEYSFVNINDSDLAINWPISLEQAIVSDKDKQHPSLKDSIGANS